MDLKFIIPVFLFATFFLIIIYFIFNLFFYIDPIYGCYIRIDERNLGGSKSTRNSLKYLKDNSTEKYTYVCSNIDKIVEKVCTGADWHLDNTDWSKETGCYLRGSKTVYLTPNTNLDVSTYISKSESLYRFAKYSHDYWTGKEKE